VYGLGEGIHLKRTGMIVIPLGVKKQFLGCSASKGPQQELSQYLSG